MSILVVVFSYKGCVCETVEAGGEKERLINNINNRGMHSYKERVYSHKMMHEVRLMNFNATSDHTPLIQK